MILYIIQIKDGLDKEWDVIGIASDVNNARSMIEEYYSGNNPAYKEYYKIISETDVRDGEIEFTQEIESEFGSEVITDNIVVRSTHLNEI